MIQALVCGHHGQRGGWQSSALCSAGVLVDRLCPHEPLQAPNIRPEVLFPAPPFPSRLSEEVEVTDRIDTEIQAVIAGLVS